jgi:FkbM family methyltransferase
VYSTLNYILKHPMNKGRDKSGHDVVDVRLALSALCRYVGWQVRSRLTDYVIVPFVNDTRLLVANGMSGATGNIYCGLNDFEEMGFVLHALRKGDLFYDIGANVGAYTVLAGATGAEVWAFEPNPESFWMLRRNRDLNESMATHVFGVALGAKKGRAFIADEGVCSHVRSYGHIQTDVKPLDDFITTKPHDLAILKIDVEGYEKDVIDGATRTLANPAVKAIIMELLIGCGCRYGYDDWELHRRMLEMGFKLHRYDPWTRELKETEEIIGGNNLYVRDAEFLRERVRTAPPYKVHGRNL